MEIKEIIGNALLFCGICVGIIYCSVTNVIYPLTHIKCIRTFRVPDVGQPKWKRAFKNIVDWDDETKKRKYEEYAAQLVGDKWKEYSDTQRYSSQYNLQKRA